MIPVTRLDGSTLSIDVDVIAWIEQTPDTLIGMTSGEKMLVRESPEHVMACIVAFKRAAQGRSAVDPIAGDRSHPLSEEAM